ncbi:MAG: DUF420 domain-containing protein [Planctomycetota bacterium]
MPEKETLALINACLNGISTCLLLWAYVQIRNKNVAKHRGGMVAALVVSALFLATYLTSNFYYGDLSTKDMGLPGWLRGSYLIFLLVHVLMAIVMLPFIAGAVYFAIRGRFETHKKFSKPAFFMWMYVSVTGVMVYLLLYQLFPRIAENPAIFEVAA